jgi:hypothetical protein
VKLLRLREGDDPVKIHKNVSAAKNAANKKNAKKSTGPKRVATKNALTHGFFARELVLNDTEKRDLETLRRSLHPQFWPNSVMQELEFGLIMVCIGRCKLALRSEMRHVRRAFDSDTTHQAQRDQPDSANPHVEWYFGGKQELRNGMTILENVKQEFLHLRRIDPKWHSVLDEAFGPRFRKLLTEWVPPKPEAAMLAQHLTRHAETLKKPLPPLDPNKDNPTLIPDPYQSTQMVLKLFEMETSMLSDLWKSIDQRNSEAARAQNDTADFAPRYFSAACRDLHRAIDRYMGLKRNNL